MLPLIEILKSKIAKNTVIAQVLGINGLAAEREVWGSPGVRGCPPKGVNGIWLPIGGDRQVIIALQNYQVNIDLAQGETALYSTDADGAIVKATVIVRADGSIELNGDSKRLVTYGELNTALQSLVTAINSHTHPETGGSTLPPTVSMSLDISAAETATIKTGG